MNEELTNEVLEAIKKCKFDCTLRGANGVCSNYDWNQKLATALLEERAKPKVWDGAPEWAKSARVMWSDTCKNEPANRGDYSPRYTRELPKTRTRIMAEEIASAHISNKDDLIDIIEQTIKNHFAELKEES